MPASTTIGYYYWGLRTKYKNNVDVTFESSDYEAMKSRHRSKVIHKLVFHANGNLTADWDPDREIILRAARNV